MDFETLRVADHLAGKIAAGDAGEMGSAVAKQLTFATTNVEPLHAGRVERMALEEICDNNPLAAVKEIAFGKPLAHRIADQIVVVGGITVELCAGLHHSPAFRAVAPESVPAARRGRSMAF